MRFKIDENLPIDAAKSLREAGHDVFTVFDQDLRGARDDTLAQVCREERRVLITLDLHFSDIRTYPPADFAGLIVLRLSRQDRPHVLEVLRRTSQLFESEALEGKLWVVDEKRVRVRS
jgi:predicted nuclease of predicted toxin-antitoxin system